eukprot:745667-Hanusia_phi.AAC.2
MGKQQDRLPNPDNFNMSLSNVRVDALSKEKRTPLAVISSNDVNQLGGLLSQEKEKDFTLLVPHKQVNKHAIYSPVKNSKTAEGGHGKCSKGKGVSSARDAVCSRTKESSEAVLVQQHDVVFDGAKHLSQTLDFMQTQISHITNSLDAWESNSEDSEMLLVAAGLSQMCNACNTPAVRLFRLSDPTSATFICGHSVTGDEGRSEIRDFCSAKAACMSGRGCPSQSTSSQTLMYVPCMQTSAGARDGEAFCLVGPGLTVIGVRFRPRVRVRRDQICVMEACVATISSLQLLGRRVKRLLDDGKSLYLQERRKNVSVVSEKTMRERDISELLKTTVELQKEKNSLRDECSKQLSEVHEFEPVQEQHRVFVGRTEVMFAISGECWRHLITSPYALVIGWSNSFPTRPDQRERKAAGGGEKHEEEICICNQSSWREAEFLTCCDFTSKKGKEGLKKRGMEMMEYWRCWEKKTSACTEDEELVNDIMVRSHKVLRPVSDISENKSDGECDVESKRLDFSGSIVAKEQKNDSLENVQPLTVSRGLNDFCLKFEHVKQTVGQLMEDLECFRKESDSFCWESNEHFNCMFAHVKRLLSNQINSERKFDENMKT